MIASIQFRHFKALRDTQLRLEPFNLLIGPNGSGKTSLIQAIMRLRNLSQLPFAVVKAEAATSPNESVLVFHFAPPLEGVEARLGCMADMVCDRLQVKAAKPSDWEVAQRILSDARAYLFDHYAMAMPSPRTEDTELASNGGNLAAVLATRRRRQPELFKVLEAEALRLLPEFSRLEAREIAGDKYELNLLLREEESWLAADSLSQGTLYLLAILALAYDPNPPAIVCIEDVDRGIHPRRLRDVRDLLYRLSYPDSYQLGRSPVQVIATTHSPYLLDQFRDHPEEVVIAHKRGRAATFERLTNRPDIGDLLSEGSLGEMWYSGILGGVPDEPGFNNGKGAPEGKGGGKAGER